jgi:hypothetical protein
MLAEVSRAAATGTVAEMRTRLLARRRGRLRLQRWVKPLS